MLDCAATERLSEPANQHVNNRDQIVYQGDYRFTPHLTALVGFHYENERGAEPRQLPTTRPVERTNYDYLAARAWRLQEPFFYTLGGSLEHYSLFGTRPRRAPGFLLCAPSAQGSLQRHAHPLQLWRCGARTQADRSGSARSTSSSSTNGGQSTAQQLHIGPLAAPTTRTYEGGVEQAFFGERSSSAPAISTMNSAGRSNRSARTCFPTASRPDRRTASSVREALGYYYNYDYGLTVNTEAFRAQGIETTVESGIGRNIFLRGGYTYLDAVVQRSFTSDNEALMGGYAPTYQRHSLHRRIYSPLVGARPFRRPPHTGFFTASYAAQAS